MDAKTKGGDVGIRARLLLEQWALARGAELTRQEDAPAHISCPECDRCRGTHSNKANLVRHIRSEHCDSSLRSQEVGSSSESEGGGFFFMAKLNWLFTILQ